MARKARGTETGGDMVRSIALLIGIVAVVAVAFTVMRPDERLPEPVDYAGVLELVREEYPYPVLAPTPEPDGWRATSVEHDDTGSGHRWRLGFLTDEEQYVGLEQSDGEIESFLSERLADFGDDGTSTIAGVTWERRIEDDTTADRALVLVENGVATVVRGTLPYEGLEDFAASLG